MTCKGVCDRYKAKRVSGMGRYASGQKRCQICEIFIEWDGRWCPCCKYRLRAKPRNLVYKEKLAKMNLKAGSEVKIYKKWETQEGFEGDAVLITLVKASIKKGKGQKWIVKFKQDIHLDGDKAKTHPRTIRLLNQ